MNIFNKIKNRKFREYVDVIEWINDKSDVLIWRFPRYKAEIKNGAQLTVSKSQVVVLVNDEQFADVYQPGSYKLTTANMPILATFKRWKYDFSSRFKADIYFANTKQFWNIPWSTENPIIMYDSDFESVKIFASGFYCFQVNPNPTKFIRNIMRIDNDFSTESVSEKLRDFVIAKFTDYLTISKITILDLASNLKEFSNELTIALKSDFLDYGLDLMKFSLKNVILPEEVIKELDKRIKINAINNRCTHTSIKNSFINGSKNIIDIRSIPNNNMSTGIGLTMMTRMGRKMTNPQDEQHKSKKLDSPLNTTMEKETPPPIPNQVMYHIAIGGVQQGPFRKSYLQQMVIKGQLTPDTLVWTMGMAGWERAKSIPSISELFNEVPPPAPAPL